MAEATLIDSAENYKFFWKLLVLYNVRNLRSSCFFNSENIRSKTRIYLLAHYKLCAIRSAVLSIIFVC